MISIITCSNSNTFTSFDIFQIELLISNILYIFLFRGRIRWFKKHCLYKKQEKATVKYIFNAKKLTKNEIGEEHINSTPDRKKPTLLPTISNTTQCETYKCETLQDKMDKILLINDDDADDDYDYNDKNMDVIDRKRIYSLRHNSISINPLLPNSWLSPRSIQTFKTSLIESLQCRLFNQQKSFSSTNLKKLQTEQLRTESEPIPTFSTFKIKNGIHAKSQSTSVLEIASIRNEINDNYYNNYSKQTTFEFKEEMKEFEQCSITKMDMLRSKSLIIDKNRENNIYFNDDKLLLSSKQTKSSVTLRNAPKSLFKKAAKWITNSQNDDCDEMILSDMDNLASVEPISAISAQKDDFKYTSSQYASSPRSKSEIIYND